MLTAAFCFVSTKLWLQTVIGMSQRGLFSRKRFRLRTYRTFCVLLTRFNEIFGTTIIALFHPASGIICFGAIHTFLRYELRNGTKLVMVLAVLIFLLIEYAVIVVANVDNECKLLMVNFSRRCKGNSIHKKILKSCKTLKFKLAGDFVNLRPIHLLKYIASVFEAVITALITYDNVGFEMTLSD